MNWTGKTENNKNFWEGCSRLLHLSLSKLSVDAVVFAQLYTNRGGDCQGKRVQSDRCLSLISSLSAGPNNLSAVFHAVPFSTWHLKLNPLSMSTCPPLAFALELQCSLCSVTYFIPDDVVERVSKLLSQYVGLPCRQHSCQASEWLNRNSLVPQLHLWKEERRRWCEAIHR